MKIIVRNLDRKTTSQEIESLFESFGKVQSCNLVMDDASGLSKGFAFVEMPAPGEAKAAIKNLNDSKQGANKIRVKYAEDKSKKA